MSDDNGLPAYLRDLYPDQPGAAPKRRDDAAEEEGSCRAFGYLRGVQDKALAVRFIFRSGNSVFLPYSCLGPWEHNPSVGLLLRFTAGDVATLVLIHGSSLDALPAGCPVNLTDRGLQRQRITWVRELDEDELRKAGLGEPTVDRIDAASFDDPDSMRAWVGQRAPAFLGSPVLLMQGPAPRSAV